MSLLQLLSREDGMSVPRVARQMVWAQSQVRRALSLLGSVEGLALVVELGTRPSRLYLTEAGRRYLEQHREA